MKPLEEGPLTVVGIGASAGGLEAILQFLEGLTSPNGMSYVYLQHQDPTHPSRLPELLAPKTYLTVREAADHMRIEPNCLYILPSNQEMEIIDGTLITQPRSAATHIALPIDRFLVSLAQNRKSRAIGVLLSGTASDGVKGLLAIKSEGGLTFAQDNQSARFSAMPLAAVAAGAVDFVLPPPEIARELCRIATHPLLQSPSPAETEPAQNEVLLPKIFGILRNASGVDFSYYKDATIRRRLGRRLLLKKFDSLGEYVPYLHAHREEQTALFEDLLIDVTGFFRDPELFDVLQQQVFPSILKSSPNGQPIRIWNPGCASGEETYSLAMSLHEFLEETMPEKPVQIFGTDVSDQNIVKARAGLYSSNALADVSPDRLRRFFVKTDRGYQISKAIRDKCIFARQNIAKDPPFLHLDLVSCRNLLIYLNPLIQKRLMYLFHTALQPHGFLVLGTAESVGHSSELFTVVDKKYKVFGRKGSGSRMNIHYTLPLSPRTWPAAPAEDRPRVERTFDIQREMDRILLTKHTPASVVINDDGEILHFRGRTTPFLEPAAGQATFNIFKMAREGLQVELRALQKQARQRAKPVHKTIRLRLEKRLQLIDLEILPIYAAPLKETYYLVLFKALGEPVKAPARAVKETRQTGQVRQELAATRTYLQSVIEDQEATNEELRAANEEIQSTNEELQSTNEEMETAKEELQSTNEELTTVNEELQTRNGEINETNNDLINLLANVNVPILMLDQKLRIRRFTPLAEKLIHVIPGDIGRPIQDLNINIKIPDLESLAHQVMELLETREMELQDKQGKWYSVRLRPYKTLENRIDGIVIAFVDIDEVRKSADKIKAYARYAQSIAETVRDPILLLNSDMRVLNANGAFFETFQVTPEETLQKQVSSLGNGQWHSPELQQLLKEILPQKQKISDFKITHDFPQIGKRTFLLNARQLIQPEGSDPLIFLTLEDITKRN